MRDEFGEIDPDEIDIIDLVEPDARAFGEHAESDVPTRGGNRRRWLVPAAVASILGVAASGLIVWSPWTDDETQSFPDSDAPELTLTERLVFGDPPAELTASSLGLSALDDGLFGFGDAEGYFFAEPGASWDFMNGGSSGTWAAFFAVRAESENVPDVDSGDAAGNVQGVPAVTDVFDGGGREVRFGPVDGWIFSVVSGGMSLAESLAFAEAVGVDDGVPTLSNERVMGTMRPIADIADYDVAVSTVLAATSNFGAQPGIVSVHYGEFGDISAFNDPPAYSIATQPVDGEATLAILQFIVGGDEGHTVHGQPAVVGEEVLDLTFEAGAQPTSLVAWVEGGRLIVVTGPDDFKATLALAETVRPATDDEWEEVVAVVQDPFAPDDVPAIDIRGSESITLYEEVDATTGDTFSFGVQFFDGSLAVCTEVQSADGGTGECSTEGGVGGLPLLLPIRRDNRSMVLAIVERGLGADAELRITLADGTIETYPLVDHGDALPGPAVATLLPSDHGAVELWIGAKVVANL